MNLPDYFLADLPPGTELGSTMVSEACRALKRNRDQYLARRSTADMVTFLAELAARWLDPGDPFRRLALERGPAGTGFPATTLARGMDAMFGEWTADNFHLLLRQELGDAHRLDRFAETQDGPGPGPRRVAMATGPRLLVHITAGNLPSPALLSIALGLLTRSAQFVKAATGASLLPRLFAHSIYHLDPKLGACLEIAEWRGGRKELEDALFAEAECVTATGSDETLADVRRLVPTGVRFLGYGQRVSFGFLAREIMTGHGARKAAASAAADVIAWNQCGCLSPHVFYVEAGGAVTAEMFGEMLAAELAGRETGEPRGPLTPAESAAIASRRALYEIRAAACPDTRQWHSGQSTAWTVVYEADPQFQFSCLNRFIYVKAVEDLTTALQAAEPVRGKVSTVGLAAPAPRAEALAAELARWGVTRVCAIGRMQHPPLTWRHDGRPALADLVTWTDWEP